MQVTKYEHACLLIEEQGQRIIIDPGIFSGSALHETRNIRAIVVTHIHPDHFDPDKLSEITHINPECTIYTTQEVKAQLANSSVKAITAGDVVKTGPFKLEFFGVKHATIHSSLPVAQNTGVMVNDSLYYPGDSFTVPSKPVRVLALPAVAPWAKIAESIDFMLALEPKVVFPTHNALLSKEGLGIYNRVLGNTAKSKNIDYKYLEPGQHITVN
ncbi:MBL fold metallo-hydrolase [soil metagenome]